jgi:hypothetical protein
VIGYYPPLLETQTGYFRTELLDWWETHFQKMRYPGHRFGYSDLLSGNLSLPSNVFEDIGGFDPRFKVHEDYELGIRLVHAGIEFVHSSKAIGYHHEQSDLIRAFQRKYEEGIADVLIGRLYPSLISTLLMNTLQIYSLPLSRLLKYFAFYLPKFGDSIAHNLKNQMNFFEHIRWHNIWQRFLNGLMGYWYWRGVSSELKSLAEVKEFLSEPLAQNDSKLVIDINIEEGLPKLEMLLDEYRPDEARVCFNQVEIGRIPYQPGSEQLRGAHLRPYLEHHLNIELIKALAEDPSFPYPKISAELITQCKESLKLKKKWI